MTSLLCQGIAAQYEEGKFNKKTNDVEIDAL